ncbi:hypothetical protein D3C84_771800 [compost metagenome]
MQADRLADLFPGAGDNVEHTGGDARLERELRHTQRRQRGLLGGFDDHRTACGECRADFPGQHQQREVPGQHAAHHPDGFTHDHGQRVTAHRGGVVINLVDQLGVPAQRMNGVRHIDQLALADWLAAVETLKDRQFVAMPFEQIGKLQQDGFALFWRNGSPAAILKRFLGVADREIDICRRASGDVRQKLTGRRIVRGEGFARDRGFERAVDEGIAGERNVFGDGGVFGLGQEITHGWLLM